SGPLDDDFRDDLSHVLAGVHRLFQPGIDLAPLDQAENVAGAVGEQGGIHLAINHVGFILQSGDFEQASVDLVRLAEVAAQADGLLEVGGGIHDDAGETDGGRRGFFRRKTSKRWEVSSMWSRISSSLVASVWMSSRSKGVMNVRSRALMIFSTWRSHVSSS